MNWIFRNEYIDLFPIDITALSTVILAFITAWYAISTYKILNEQEKLRKIAKIEREIAFIEKQLKDFYYPLDNFLKRYFSFKEKTRDNPEHYLDIASEIRDSKTRNDLFEYKDIIKNQYLATEEIEENLIDFLEEKNISGLK